MIFDGGGICVVCIGGCVMVAMCGIGWDENVFGMEVGGEFTVFGDGIVRGEA